MDKIDKIFMVFSVIVIFLGITYLIIQSPKNQVELHYPYLEHGARIPGTNYTVDGKDTLEIVKSIHYSHRLLDKAERAQAREYIKSLRD